MQQEQQRCHSILQGAHTARVDSPTAMHPGKGSDVTRTSLGQREAPLLSTTHSSSGVIQTQTCLVKEPAWLRTLEIFNPWRHSAIQISNPPFILQNCLGKVFFIVFKNEGLPCLRKGPENPSPTPNAAMVASSFLIAPCYYYISFCLTKNFSTSHRPSFLFLSGSRKI